MQTHIFNPPPGWPAMPTGWEPGPEWRPDPSWPAPPPGWIFFVPVGLKMKPLDLTRDVEFGDPSRLTIARVHVVGQAAADAVAWQLCKLAAEQNLVPMIAYLRFGEQTEIALKEAQRRVYDPLIDDMKKWVDGLRMGSAEWAAAYKVYRLVVDARTTFLRTARRRIQAVLEASGPSSAPRPPAHEDAYTAPPSPRPSAPANQAAVRADGLAWARTAYRHAALSAVVHAAIFLAGVLLTWYGFERAAQRGTFVILYGAVIWGVVGAVRATSRYHKARKVHDELRVLSASTTGPEEENTSTERPPGNDPPTPGKVNTGDKVSLLAGVGALIFFGSLIFGWWWANSSHTTSATTAAPATRPVAASTASSLSKGTAIDQRDACRQAVEKQLGYPDPRTAMLTYSRTTTFNTAGVPSTQFEGIAEDNLMVQPRMQFSCRVENSPGGGWNVTSSVSQAPAQR